MIKDGREICKKYAIDSARVDGDDGHVVQRASSELRSPRAWCVELNRKDVVGVAVRGHVGRRDARVCCVEGPGFADGGLSWDGDLSAVVTEGHRALRVGVGDKTKRDGDAVGAD